MELKVENEKENKLFQRKEIWANAVYDGKTPTREEIKEGLSKKLGLNPELVELVKIDQIYGLRSSKVLAYYYSTKEAMESHAKKKKEKKGGAAPAEKKEAPKEEKKEEKKEEPKKEEKKEGPKKEAK